MRKGTLKLPPGTTGRTVPQPKPATVAAQWLAETWPLLFDPIAPVPLAIGIRRDLLKLRPAKVSDAGLRKALRRWCNSPGYLAALAAGGTRHGLDGPAGTVTPAQAKHATAALLTRYP